MINSETIPLITLQLFEEDWIVNYNYYTSPQSFIIPWFIKLSVKKFQPLILVYRIVI